MPRFFTLGEWNATGKGRGFEPALRSKEGGYGNRQWFRKSLCCSKYSLPKGGCWPAIPTIARELKLSQSTVRRALQDLRKAELLETGQRYRAKGGKSGLLFWLRKVWQVKGTTPKRYYRQIKNSDAAILNLTGCFNRGNPCGCRNFSLTTTPSGNMLYLAA